ncbi:hydrolase [Alcanivorax xiamenensis]|uniref:Hydrolase n=1 Tax=Alcanivorax xiamenensis TaxID=1177156 RepID=A0ABQ6Y9J9_9GAMM|nr:alpha/beta hydrolase [Alcanivorax xiamenensis]KAF0806325.1 hydrolase [Alcanivorax xiamenensis]
MTTTWILLRGLIREQAHWQGFDRHLADVLGGEHEVRCVDLPGNGQRYHERSPTTVAEMVDAARAELGDEVLSRRPRLVALSLGGMVGMDWLRRFPGELGGAALINSSTARFSPFHQRLRARNYPRLLRDVLLSRDTENKERAILELTTNLLAPERLTEVAREWALIAGGRPVSTANSLRQLWAAARFQAPARLPGSSPVLIVNGGGDRLVSPCCSQALARAWNRPLSVHPAAGHDLSLDAPDWLARELKSWVVTPGA